MDLKLDEEGYRKAMQEQRDKARAAWAGSVETKVNPVYKEVAGGIRKPAFTEIMIYFKITDRFLLSLREIRKSPRRTRVTRSRSFWTVHPSMPNRAARWETKATCSAKAPSSR
jgi:hypothetical protein